MQIPGADFLIEMGVPARAAQGIIIGVALLVVFLILSKLFKPKPGGSHLTPSRCSSCGWIGSVSKHKPTCPKCAKPITL